MLIVIIIVLAFCIVQAVFNWFVIGELRRLCIIRSVHETRIRTVEQRHAIVPDTMLAPRDSFRPRVHP